MGRVGQAGHLKRTQVSLALTSRTHQPVHRAVARDLRAEGSGDKQKHSENELTTNARSQRSIARV